MEANHVNILKNTFYLMKSSYINQFLMGLIILRLYYILTYNLMIMIKHRKFIFYDKYWFDYLLNE